MAKRSSGGAHPYLALAGLVLAAWGPTAALAQSRSPGEAAVLACRPLADPAQQLACFRKAGDVLAAETTTQGAAQPPPKKLPFGAPKPHPVRAAKAAVPDSLKVKLLSFADRGDGRVVFRFDDGSTWVQTQTDEPVAGSLSVGDTLTLRRGLFSGCILEIPGRSFVRVARMGGG